MNQEGESEGEKDRIRYGEAFKPKVMEELRDGKFKSVKEAAIGYGIAEGVDNWCKAPAAV